MTTGSLNVMQLLAVPGLRHKPSDFILCALVLGISFRHTGSVFQPAWDGETESVLITTEQ